MALLSILATGCEGYRCGSGYILDKADSQPLDSVLCEVTTGDETAYTDSSGHFSVCNPFGGCAPKCKDIRVRFSKAGYKTVSVENPDGKPIFLEK